MKKIGIILINYKDYARRFLPECRDSLYLQDYPREFFQVYIVDNSSSDESRKFLGEIYPEAIVIPRGDGNYAAGNNAGLKKALADGCDAVVIANMDTKFVQSWLTELVRALETNPEAVAAQSKVLLYPGTEAEWREPKINSLGNIFHFLGFGFTNGYKEDDREINGYPEITGYATGCSVILRREALEKIGGYNEEYYMYHDDVDIGWKLKLAGYKIVLAPRSVVYHKYEFSRAVRMLYYMERNRYLAMFEFYKLPTIILLLPAIVAMDLGMWFFSILRGWFPTKLRVLGYFLRPSSWRKILVTRRELAKIRVKTDREITQNFSGRVLFQEIDNPILKYIANPIFNFYWQVVKKTIWW